MTGSLKTANFVLKSGPGDIPDKARDMAALLLLDTLGVSIAATPMDSGVIARNTAYALYGTRDAQNAARLMLDGRTVSVAGAGFAIATQTDNLDAHDGYNPVKGHIGCAVIPALLAFAESIPDLSGPDALASLVIGYEIAGRAGEALHASVSDYHTSGAWNAVGVAALGARLKGFSKDQFRHAIGIAEYHGPRSQMMREIANPTMLHDGSGMGALVGISAVIMAEQGFTGAPAITVEDEAVGRYWQDIGTRWLSLEQYIKPYPICRWAHAAIDAARSLMLEYGFAHDMIAQIEINTFHESACLFGGMPETTSQAQYSLGFAVAQMLVNGQVGVAQITGYAFTDPRVAALLAKTQVHVSEEHNALFPAHRTADVAITLADGRVLESGLVHARGGTEDPMSTEDMYEKFMMLAEPVLGERRALKLRDAAVGLNCTGARFDDLTQWLYDPV